MHSLQTIKALNQRASYDHYAQERALAGKYVIAVYRNGAPAGLEEFETQEAMLAHVELLAHERGVKFSTFPPAIHGHA